MSNPPPKPRQDLEKPHVGCGKIGRVNRIEVDPRTLQNPCKICPVQGPTCRSRWSYAATKMVDEFLALAYFQEYGLKTATLRLFNTVGVRQTGHYGMVIPRFMQQALSGKPITVYGDGSQRRCFCDVRDVVRAILSVIDCEKAYGQIANVGGTVEISMNELAERVKTAAGSRSEIVRIPYEKAYAPGFEDMERRVPDLSKIRALIGWTPQIGLDETLRCVCDHLREHAESEPHGAGP
jgi:UDP-glucose 4-epimerase